MKTKFLSRFNFTPKIHWAKLSFIFLGISSTAWFLMRVIPKPSRAAYPCMRTAAPIMSSFVLWLIALVGSMAAFRLFQINKAKSKFGLAALFLVGSLCFALVTLNSRQDKLNANPPAIQKFSANAPMGVERGIFPGRVVWVHDKKVATWDKKTGFWWEDAFISQKESDRMLLSSITSLTGQRKAAKAWEQLFVHFNTTKNKGNFGYKTGQKIAIKINQNNTDSHKNTNEINATPQLMLSVLKSLVNDAKVAQKDITVFDASRFITDNIFDKCHAAFPEVVFVDNSGGDGRVKAEYVDNALPYSIVNGKLATGLAKCVVEADYLINLAILKGHVGQGVTLCGKNYYGATSINADWRKNGHDNFDPDREGKPRFMTFVDFMGHKDLGEKTVLFLLDGFIGTKMLNGVPEDYWKMSPFNGNWACSLFASQDGVAIDAVGIDFLINEFPDAPDLNTRSDQYLIEASLANDPPSKTFYDPERDKTRCTSLGVLEHWNNATDKKYSRNLGKKKGIELLPIELN